MATSFYVWIPAQVKWKYLFVHIMMLLDGLLIKP
jgi:hypothetical protein